MPGSPLVIGTGTGVEMRVPRTAIIWAVGPTASPYGRMALTWVPTAKISGPLLPPITRLKSPRLKGSGKA